jgi:hypothetical protein
VESAQKNLGLTDSISYNSTDNEFPSSKAVYDFIEEAISPGEFVVTATSRVYVSNNKFAFEKTYENSDITVLRNIVFGGNKRFVAVGEKGVIIYSNDAINWNKAEIPSGLASDYMTSIAWGQNKFSAMTNMGEIITSDDGINWSSMINVGITPTYNLIYANNKWVVVGDSQIAVSQDLTNWTVAFSGGTGFRAVTYGAGKFIVGGKSQILYSYDGLNWTLAFSAFSSMLHGLTYSKTMKMYVGVGFQSDEGFYSSDGINWTVTQLPALTNWNNVTYGANKFVAVGGNNIIYSYDGINWTKIDNLDSIYYQGIVYIKNGEL